MMIGSMVVRDARPNDALAIARIHVRSWQVGYRGLLPDDYLDRMKAEDRAARYTLGSADRGQPATLVAEDFGILGFVTTGPARAPDTGKGELGALYVAPESWGKGIGTALIEAAHLRLKEGGFADAVLWLLAGNERGLRFYLRHAWAPSGTSKTAEVWGVRVKEIQLERRLT